MKAPLTKAAFAKAGVKFRQVREETAAGYIDRTLPELHGSDDHKAVLSWLFAHRGEWPATWDDAKVAERLPQVIAEYVPQLAKPRAAMDKPAFQAILRAAQAALFAC